MGVFNFNWCPEAVETLSAMWKSGYSATCIANALGKPATRSSVIGKVHRLRLHDERPRNVNGRASAMNMRPPPKLVVDNTPTDQPEPVLLDGCHITMETLRHNHCRWPIGDVPGLYFCGNPPQAGSVYCEFHRLVCYPKPIQAAAKAKYEAASQRQFRGR